MNKLTGELPRGYYLQRDPDTLILRRHNDSIVAVFNSYGLESNSIRYAIEDEEHQGASIADRETKMSVAVRDQYSLHAHFLGQFEVLCDGLILPLPRRTKTIAILKHLLASQPRPVSQHILMNRLWPQSNLKRARSSLNSAIHDLRKLLSTCHPKASMNYVLNDKEFYRLNPGIPLTTDVGEFDARYERGRRLQREGEVAEAVAEFEKAVQLYRNDYLFEDLHEDWTLIERERLLNGYLDMVNQLAVHYLNTRRFQQSIQACHQVLEKDRCHEDSHCLLVRCYVRLGFYGRALDQYRSFERLLRRNYGMELSPQSRATFEDALRTIGEPPQTLTF